MAESMFIASMLVILMPFEGCFARVRFFFSLQNTQRIVKENSKDGDSFFTNLRTGEKYENFYHELQAGKRTQRHPTDITPL